ncbi:MAG: carboxypeptidase regulatory-like domain-containing protein, partial [Planctomycetota bacterium]
MGSNRIILYGFIVGLMVLAGVVLAADQGGAHLRFSLGKAADEKSYTVTVSGKVTDAATGKPIADALVRGHIVAWRHRGPDLFDKCPYIEIRSDQNGMYSMEFVTPLTTSGAMKGKDGICVYASAPGYEHRPVYVRPRVTPDKTNYTNIDIVLQHGKLVKGKIVDQN